MMRYFRHKLKELQPEEVGERQWLFVASDHLSDQIGPLSRNEPSTMGLVFVESAWHIERNKDSKEKLAVFLSNQRHFACEQAERGVAIRYIVTHDRCLSALQPLVDTLGPMQMMMSADQELMVDLLPLLESKQLQLLPHDGWLTGQEHGEAETFVRPGWSLKPFLSYLRRNSMELDEGKLVAERFALAAETMTEPALPQRRLSVSEERHDPIRAEVVRWIGLMYGAQPGCSEIGFFPASQEESREYWRWVCETYFDSCEAPDCPPFVTALLYMQRIRPDDVLEELVGLEVPFQRKRQLLQYVLGCHEFMRHLHRVIDRVEHLSYHQAANGSIRSLKSADSLLSVAKKKGRSRKSKRCSREEALVG